MPVRSINCHLLFFIHVGTIHKSPFNRHPSKLMKKHVQFPDEYNKCCPSSDTQLNVYCNDTNGNGQTMAINSHSGKYFVNFVFFFLKFEMLYCVNESCQWFKRKG